MTITAPAILWATGITADHTVTVDHKTRQQVLECLRGFSLRGLEQALQFPGKDHELRCDDRATFQEVQERVQSVLAGAEIHSDVGGSPAISTLAGSVVGGDVHYAGNVGTAARAVLERVYNGKSAVFLEGNPLTDHCSETVALELAGGEAKVMISHSEGRSVRDLDRRMFQRKVESLYHPEKGLLLALGGLSKGQPQEYASLAREITGRRDRTYLFVGTNSFGSNGEAVEKAGAYWNSIIGEGQIISMNEQEALAVYKALRLPQPEPSVVEMLQGLQQYTSGILVIHTAAGAIASPNGFVREQVQQALQMAVSGATWRYAEGNFGTAAEINAFSQTNGVAYEQFQYKFGVSPRDLPAGIAYAVAHDLQGKKTKGNLTGAGATFDGILVTYLAPLLGSEKVGLV